MGLEGFDVIQGAALGLRPGDWIALLDDTALGNGIEALGVALGRGDAAATCPDRLQCTSADCCFERHKNYPLRCRE